MLHLDAAERLQHLDGLRRHFGTDAVPRNHSHSMRHEGISTAPPPCVTVTLIAWETPVGLTEALPEGKQLNSGSRIRVRGPNPGPLQLRPLAA